MGGLPRGVAPAKTLDDCVVEGTIVRTELFDGVRLSRTGGSSVSREDIDADFEEMMGAPLPCLAVHESGRANFDTYLAAIPGSALCQLYTKYNTRLLIFTQK